MKDKIKKQVIEDYKNTFGIQDIPYKNLGKDDKKLIKWTTSLVKNLTLCAVVKPLKTKYHKTFGDWIDANFMELQDGTYLHEGNIYSLDHVFNLFKTQKH